MGTFKLKLESNKAVSIIQCFTSETGSVLHRIFDVFARSV